MQRSSAAVFAALFLLLLAMSGKLSANQKDPCQNDGTLKGWAIKQGYSAEDCSPTSDGDGSGGDSTTDGGNTDPCQSDGTLKGWARKDGYSADYCQSDTTAPAEENLAPSVTIDSPVDGYTADTDTIITFSGSASDAEDGDLTSTITWTSSLDGTIADSTSLSAGSHLVSATVTDSAGATASARITVDITQQNTAPTLSIISPTDGYTAEEGTTLTFSASASDAEDGDLSANVAWSSSLDGSIPSSSTLSVGSHLISATVTDSAGATASSQISVEITQAAPEPTTKSVTLNWQAPTQREDGSSLALSEIGGYEIYVIADTGNENVITISDNTATSYALDFAIGTSYHLAVSSYDNQGNYSALSDTVSVTVQ